MKAGVVALAIAAAAISFSLGRLTPRNAEPAETSANRQWLEHTQTSETIMPAPALGTSAITTERVQSSSRPQTIRVLGTVKADENKVYRLIAGVPGRLTSLGQNSPGTIVRRNAVLATFFSNEFVKAEQAYFFSLDSLKRDRASARNSDPLRSEESVQSQEALLISMGMGEEQMRELAKTRQVTREVAIVSPVNGVVLSRSLFPRQQLEEAQEMYRIAGLESVFVFAAVTPAEMALIAADSKVQVRALTTGRIYEATIHPGVYVAGDPGPRLQLKIEVANKDLLLLPDMPVEVEFQAPPSLHITVPATAVLDTGFEQRVFVQSTDGSLQQRIVQAGPRLGDRVVIHRGLTPQERVLVSANFFLDSESRLRAH